MIPETSDIGLIGLAVMGQNLVLNMNDHGYTVSVFNRTVSKVDEFLSNEAKGTKVVGTKTIQELVQSLKKPKIVMLLVKAGPPVDDFIAKLVDLMSSGDIIIDGGNSDYKDTERRYISLKDKGILFVGSGVSGGEEGARYGPSLMPGGHPDAWPHIKPIFQAISAKVGNSEPCCDWAGTGGAGHFVKMVHNGIEYGDMQLICEAYHLLRDVCLYTSDQMAEIFRKWNTGDLDSFLIEITANILTFKDANGAPLVEQILDKAGQKGTGRWTVENGLELGCPITLIAESVFSRNLSAWKNERFKASTQLPGPRGVVAKGDTSDLIGTLSDAEKTAFVDDIGHAIYASKLVSYTQGFMMMQQTESTGWELNLGSIALMWRGGCIIRSRFLSDIKVAFDKNPKLENLLLDPFFTQIIGKCQAGWRRVVSQAALCGVPAPAISSALAFYDGYRCARLPANLIQAQRDYFGAHQYELSAKPGEFVHTNWTGKGGAVASSTYQA